MKETESVVIAKEELDTYRQKVVRMEQRRQKLLFRRKWGDIAGGTVFFLAAICAAYALADMVELPVIPQLQFLGAVWKALYEVFLPKGYSAQEGLLFSVLVTVLIALDVHLITSLAVGAAYAEAPPEAPEGSASEQAAALCERCKAAGAGLPPRKKWTVTVTYALILLIPTLFAPEELEALKSAGLLAGFVAVIVTLCVFMLIYAVPYGVLLWLSGLFYRIRREPELETALDTYAKSCRVQEEEHRRAEEERRRLEKLEQDRLRGDELYRRAIAGGGVDEGLVRQAAELGCRPACLYLGRQKMEAWATGPYTKKEKEGLAEEAKGYFRTASLEENYPESKTEAQFGYLMFQVLTESGSAAKWKGVLSQLRDIQKSGLLPEQYRESCAMLVNSVIDMIDSLPAPSAGSQKRSSEPVVKRCYCRFLDHGTCRYYSGSYYTAPCEHMSDPGQCSAALLEHGLAFEFE